MGKCQWKVEEDGVLKVRTCAWSPPGDHPVGCGMFLHIEDGKVVKVEGDPDHPITHGRLCPRCIALDEVMYNERRILHPMIRAREDRGKDKWVESTWDECLDILEEKVRYIKENWGPESIYVFQGTGRESTLYAPAMGSAVLGTPNASFMMSGYSCYGPRCAVADFLLGAGYPEMDYAAFFPDRYDDPRYEVPKYILIWGKNPIYSNPDGLFGHAVVDLMKRGSKLITVDSRVTWLGVRAEYHIQLRPGTDAAVALAMLNVIIGEDIYDHEFVEKWCYGFDELAERVKDCTPEWAGEIAGVDADIIRNAARAFANNSPSTLLWGLAIDTMTNGIQAGQALLYIVAICGYFDVPGGVTLAKPTSFMGQWRYDCSEQLDPDVWANRACLPEYGAFYNTFPGAHPDSLLAYAEKGDPYPMKMAWFFGTNGMANTTFAEPKRWMKQLEQIEFGVDQDIFMTPTAMAFCDMFLPLTTFAEHDGVVLPHFGRNTHFLGAMNKAVEVGDCKSDLEILMWAGKRLNPEAWPWDTASEFFTEQIGTQYDFTFDDLRDVGIYQQPFEYRKYEKGLLRSDGQPGFETMTGMIELSSMLYAYYGEDPLPYFEEPHFSPFSDKMSDEDKEKYPLVLTTGGRNLAMFHSEHRQIPSLRAINPDPLVEISPEDAERYGIKDGDWVAMENMFGQAVEKAKVTPVVKPGVVHAQHGWWFPEQDGESPNLFGVFKSSVNSLIPNFHTSKLGYGAPYKNVVCRIYKVDSLDALTK